MSATAKKPTGSRSSRTAKRPTGSRSSTTAKKPAPSGSPHVFTMRAILLMHASMFAGAVAFWIAQNSGASELEALGTAVAAAGAVFMALNKIVE